MAVGRRCLEPSPTSMKNEVGSRPRMAVTKFARMSPTSNRTSTPWPRQRHTGGGLDIVILNAYVGRTGLGDDPTAAVPARDGNQPRRSCSTGRQPRCQHCRPAAAGDIIATASMGIALTPVRSDLRHQQDRRGWSVRIRSRHRSLKVCEPTRYAQPLPNSDPQADASGLVDAGCHCCVWKKLSTSTSTCWLEPRRNVGLCSQAAQ